MAFPNFSEFSASQWAVLAAGAGLVTYGAVDIYRRREARLSREYIQKVHPRLAERLGRGQARKATWEEECLTKYRKQGMTEREAFSACFGEKQPYGAKSKSRKTMTKKKSRRYMMGPANEQARIDAEIATFPKEFGLRAFPGRTFRINSFESFVSDSRIYLYVYVKRPDGWAGFSKGTPGELRAQVVKLDAARSRASRKSTLDRISDAIFGKAPRKRRRNASRAYGSRLRSLRKIGDFSRLPFSKWLSQVDWILDGLGKKRTGPLKSAQAMRSYYRTFPGMSPRHMASHIVYLQKDDSAKSRPSRRRASRKTLWIRRNVRRPGALTRMLRRAGTIKPGQRIPLWVKKRGCKKPRVTYQKIFGNIPPQAVARLFQRRACLARTFHQLPPSRGRLGAVRRRPKRKRKAA